MRRLLALLLALAVWGGAALAEPYIVRYPDAEHYGITHALLLARDGAVLCDPDAYAGIVPLTPPGTAAGDRLYGATRCRYPLGAEDGDDVTVNALRLLDGRGEPVTGFEFESLAWDAFAGRVVYRRILDSAPRCGLMDRAGNRLGEWPLHYLTANGEGGYVGWDEDGNVFRVDGELRISETGLVNRSVWHEGVFSDGRMPMWVEAGDIYIDGQGEPAFDGDFDDTGDYHGGWATVRLDSGWALMDTEGELLPGRYGDILWSEPDRGYLCVDPSGVDFYRVDEGMRVTRIPVEAPEGWELDCIYSLPVGWEDDDDITRLPRWKGVIGIVEAGKGLYAWDTEGAPLFHLEDEPGWDWYYDYREECDGTPETLAMPLAGDRHVLIDRAGRRISGPYSLLTAPIWRDGAGVFRYTIRDEESWEEWYGVIDGQGRDILGGVYDDLDVLDLDRFWVRRNDRWGLVDAGGNWLFELWGYGELLD